MNTYKRHRFPPDIISYAVWLYYRFNLSHRDIDDLLAERGIIVSYETIRLWCIKFGATYTKRLLRSHGGEPRKIVTDKLRSYGVAHRELMPDVIHDNSQYANNRAEQSHELTRVRERGMRRFTSVGQAQRFLGAHAAVHNLFNLGRHLIRAQHYRDLRISALAEWSRVVA
jgi:putative transposase